jgi:hypothetical protein
VKLDWSRSLGRGRRDCLRDRHRYKKDIKVRRVRAGYSIEAVDLG